MNRMKTWNFCEKHGEHSWSKFPKQNCNAPLYPPACSSLSLILFILKILFILSFFLPRSQEYRMTNGEFRMSNSRGARKPAPLRGFQLE